MEIEKALKKIKKCLALAKSNNPNEASNALRQAQSLMRKYNVSEDDAVLSDVNEFVASAGASKNPPKYHQMLVTVITNSFAVDAIYDVGVNLSGYRLKVKFIGVGCNPEIALYAYEVLFRQIKRDRTEFLKSIKRLKRATRIRRADLFCQAWVNSVYSKVTAFVASDTDKALISKFMEQQYKNLGKAESKEHKAQKRDQSAQVAGYVAGNKAQLHRGTDRDNNNRLEAL